MKARTSKSEQAIEAEFRGRRALARHHRDRVEATVHRLEAEAHLADRDRLLEPPTELLRAANEAIPAATAEETWTGDRATLLHTLGSPNAINIEASEARLKAALKAGVLPMALDASQTAQAANSLENMLCHQMAAAHEMAMRLAAMVLNFNGAAADLSRLVNASSRTMQAYTEGYLALHKTKAGGKQTVVVQHVHVQEGGQAVVAGELRTRTRGPKRGGTAK